MRNLNEIINEKNLKVKEFENNKILKEKINNQWKEIENNIDNAEINYNTKLIFLCCDIMYDDNILKLTKFGYDKNNISYFNGCSYYKIDKENKLHKDDRLKDKLNKNSRNNIKTIINSLNNESDSKYNLNDGQHNNRKDVFGKRINKENKINIDNVDKLSEENYNKIKYYSKEGDNIKEKYTKNYTVLNLNDGKGKLETYKDGRKISEQEINLKDDLSSYIKSKDFINKYIKLVNEIEKEML